MTVAASLSVPDRIPGNTHTQARTHTHTHTHAHAHTHQTRHNPLLKARQKKKGRESVCVRVRVCVPGYCALTDSVYVSTCRLYMCKAKESLSVVAFQRCRSRQFFWAGWNALCSRKDTLYPRAKGHISPMHTRTHIHAHMHKHTLTNTRTHTHTHTHSTLSNTLIPVL